MLKNEEIRELWNKYLCDTPPDDGLTADIRALILSLVEALAKVDQQKHFLIEHRSLFPCDICKWIPAQWFEAKRKEILGEPYP